jgi:hypothetical protein
MEIPQPGALEKFKGKDTREERWLLAYGLNQKQSKKPQRQLKLSLGADLA